MGLDTAAELREAVLGMDPGDFVSQYLFEPIPYAFTEDFDLWIAWKTKLATALVVDPYEIVLTGSAAVGFSLNPSKNCSPYHDKSDIDVGVISLHHFEIAWHYLRKSRPSWLSLPKATQRALKWHRENYVFEGAIATDSILPLLPFGKLWQSALDEMGATAPTIGRDVKLRIYRDFDALRAYHANGLRKLRADFLDAEVPEVEVPLEDDEL